MACICYYYDIASAAGTLKDRATDAKGCDGVSGPSVPGSTKAWSDRSRDGGSRHTTDTDAEPADGRPTETGGRNTEQADNGKLAAKRALVFVAEDVTATRYSRIMYHNLL